MGGKAAVFLGLVAGLVVGGAAVGAVIALAPPPPASVVPVASVAPSAAASPAAAASGGPGPSAGVPSVAPSGSGAASPGSSPDATSLGQAFGVGEPAPPLVLPTVGGETVNLRDYRGKPVWVNFMATWCPPCRDELPLMEGFLARYEKAGLMVLVVDVKEDESVAQPFFQDLGVYVPVALDADGAAQSAWRAISLPVHFWIDEDGIVRDGALGGIGADVMAEGLQTILPGVKVTP